MKFMLMLHLLGIVIWVGGMFFAHQVLRPVAAEQLDPSLRLPLWVAVFRRFFPWVWMCVLLILASGLFMIALMGGMKTLPLHVHAMFGLGLIMMAIFAYVFFVPFARLKQAVAAQDWKLGGTVLANIRQLVGINLTLGLLTIAVATAGAMLA